MPEDEVSLTEYRQVLRAVELGLDEALVRRGASDITLVPDTADLAAYVSELRRHLRPEAESASAAVGVPQSLAQHPAAADPAVTPNGAHRR